MSADWVYDALGSEALQASEARIARKLLAELSHEHAANAEFVHDQFLTESLEFAVFTLLGEPDARSDLRAAAVKAFDSLRITSFMQREGQGLDKILRTACYGVLADRTPDVMRFLKGVNLDERHYIQENWGNRVKHVITNIWLRLIRKSGWHDLDKVVQSVSELRSSQKEHENNFLEQAEDEKRTKAWELIAEYHLAKAAEILALYTVQGQSDGTYDVRQQLEAQFDRSVAACEKAELIELFSLTKLLAATAERIVANSIWTVTRAVNSRVTQFVRQLTDRDRPRPVFEMLPPQRVSLHEEGLLGSSHRSVVVSLPTSSGKTFIAQFRMLQALNQFELEQGWVAYIAPTRALVNQITAKLRREFEPLGIVVERVSPALEISSIEAQMLAEHDKKNAFRILVSTPEKLDLLLRGGLEKEIGRPLTLVVVDEAHNIGYGERGLRLELLLATINRECRNSQFLLLTPFISNRKAIAEWLSPGNSQDISVAFDWQPNDRAVVLASPRKADKLGDFHIDLKTIHTNRNTLNVSETVRVASGRPMKFTWSSVSSSLSNVAAVTAQSLQSRGPVIVVAGKIPDVWSLARKLANATETKKTSEDINLVCQYIEREMGADFELLTSLRKGIGVHHSGLSDDVRTLMEWLVERGQLDVLVATTTIAQGVNFPVSGVVIANHQYPYGEDMPSEDFWNLAGRVGRADQVGLGVVALASNGDKKDAQLEKFVQRKVEDLNSTLIKMVIDAAALGKVADLSSLFYMKEWSAFLQYLAHTYRQVGSHRSFALQIEQVLRGSFGFQKIREENSHLANALVAAVGRYADKIQGKPLALVDATGFSWESVSIALNSLNIAELNADIWDYNSLFKSGNSDLKNAFGVLFKVPELRTELEEASGGRGPDGDLLARIVKDWVHGASIMEIAKSHFSGSSTEHITAACKSVYGKLIQTASWGLSALQSLTLGSALDEMEDDKARSIRNLPAMVFYGVNTEAAINLRLLGVPRSAAQRLADFLNNRMDVGTADLRRVLVNLDERSWKNAIGEDGHIYQKVWKIVEGRD